MVSRLRLRLPLLGLLVALLLGGHHSAQAATFIGLSQTRSVAIGGQLSLEDFETGEIFTASQSFNEHTSPGDLGLFDRSVGLGSLLLDTPLGSGQGSGRAAQTSQLGSERIVFDGTADVFMSGQVHSFNAAMTGSGGAASRLSYRFALAQDIAVLLDAASELGPRGNAYTFSLTRDNGEVVWDQTSIIDGDGNEQRVFTTHVVLTAGVYNLETALTATSFFSGNFGFAGRALARFSITPVPLTNPLVLLASAGTLIAGLGRRRRSTLAR